MSRVPGDIRDVSPCAGCTERFLACQDRCPKDARGEKGINAWKAEIARVNKARKDYKEQSFERSKSYQWYKGRWWKE